MDIFDDIMREVFWYSIGFATYVEKDGNGIPELQGSGVLIQHDQYQGILTAAHVAQRLENLDYVSVVYNEDKTGYTYKRNLFVIDMLMYEKGDSYGPDLALVTPPPPLLGVLKSKKSFVHLESMPLLTAGANDTHIRQWCICGAAAELSEHEGETHNFKIGFMTFLCSEPKFITRSCYDIFEVEADYGQPTDTPLSFGGASGAGLWRTVIKKIGEGEEYEICEHPKLAGIAFYQTDLIDKKRTIRGHGISSMYTMAVQGIKKRST
jgi:hypothetical protein